MTDYGAANKYGFNDSTKWYTVKDVPLLDEHTMTSETGKPVADVDRAALEEIARNNNKRVYETGDPATLILGHTSDDPRAPEKPAVGFVTGYSVKPFKRDPVTGRIIFAIHGDYKLRHDKKHLLESYPRRSVELWWEKRELDPIALLGGSSPERDLGVVIRNGRINHVSIDTTTKHGTRNGTDPTETSEVRKYRRNGRDYTIISYGIETPIRRSRATQGATSMNGNGCPSRNGHRTPDRRYGAMGDDCGDDGMPKKYADGLMDSDDDHDAGDEGIPDEGDGMDSAESDPVLAKLFQSKQWKQLSDAVQQITQALSGGAEQGNDPGTGPDGMPGTPDDGMGSEMPPPGGGGMGGPPPALGGMGGGGGDDGMAPEEDERRMHGEAPVQMGMGPSGVSGSAMPGASNTHIPSTHGKRNKPYQRGTTTVNPTQSRTKPEQSRIAALERDNRALKLKYAKSEAAAIIQGLEAEGIQFGQTPEQHEKGKADDTAFLTALLADGDEQEVNYQVNNVIRARYARKRVDPAAPTAVGLSRFSRQPQSTDGPAANGADADDNFEDSLQDDRQVCEFADLQAVRKMSRADAIKFMRKRHGIR